MRKYELVCIIHPDIDENGVAAAIEKIKSWVVEASGSVDKVESWGRKHLAYTIKKQREGHYVLFNLSLNPEAANILERNLRFLEPVLRFMIIVVD